MNNQVSYSSQFALKLFDTIGIDHSKKLPTALKFVIFLWFLLAVADIPRMFSSSIYWLLPALFNFTVCYKLLSLRPKWRMVTLIYNWILMIGTVLADVVMCLSIFVPSINITYISELIDNSKYNSITNLVLTLVLSLVIILFCWWQNWVLTRPNVQNIFSD